MPHSIEFGATQPATTRMTFSVVQRVYAPLILSLPISLTLTAVLLIAITIGVLPVSPSRTINARLTDALTLLPQLFVVCVSACWLLFGLCMPFSALRPSREGGLVK